MDANKHADKQKYVIPLVDAFMFSRVRIDNTTNPLYRPTTDGVVKVQPRRKDGINGIFCTEYIPAYSFLARLGPNVKHNNNDPGIVVTAGANIPEGAAAYALPLELFYGETNLKDMYHRAVWENMNNSDKKALGYGEKEEAFKTFQNASIEDVSLIYLPSMVKGEHQREHQPLPNADDPSFKSKVQHVGIGSYSNEPDDQTHATAYSYGSFRSLENLPCMQLTDEEEIFMKKRVSIQKNTLKFSGGSNNAAEARLMLTAVMVAMAKHKILNIYKTHNDIFNDCIRVLKDGKRAIEIGEKKLHFRLPDLIAAHDLFPGDEITWNYGKEYVGRNGYKPGFVPRRTLTAPNAIDLKTGKIGFINNDLQRSNEIMFHTCTSQGGEMPLPLQVSFIERGIDEPNNCNENNFTPSGRCLEHNAREGSEYYIDFGTFRYSLPPTSTTVEILSKQIARLCAVNLTTGIVTENPFEGTSEMATITTGVPPITVTVTLHRVGVPDFFAPNPDFCETVIVDYKVIKKDGLMLVEKINNDKIILEKQATKVNKVTNPVDNLYVIEWASGDRYNTTVDKKQADDWKITGLKDEREGERIAKIHDELDQKGYYVFKEAIHITDEMHERYRFGKQSKQWGNLSGRIFNTTDSKNSCRGQVRLSKDQITDKTEHAHNIWSNPRDLTTTDPFKYANTEGGEKNPERNRERRKDWDDDYRNLHKQVYNHVSSTVSPYLVPREGVLLSSDTLPENKPCPRQSAHRDYTTSNGAYSVVIPAEDPEKCKTELLVWPKTHKEHTADCKAENVECLELGMRKVADGYLADMLLFSDTLIHAGARYAKPNNRFHFFCDTLRKEYECREKTTKTCKKPCLFDLDTKKCQARPSNETAPITEQWTSRETLMSFDEDANVLYIPKHIINEFPMADAYKKENVSRRGGDRKTKKESKYKYNLNITTTDRGRWNDDYIFFMSDHVGIPIAKFPVPDSSYFEESGIKGYAKVVKIESADESTDESTDESFLLRLFSTDESTDESTFWSKYYKITLKLDSYPLDKAFAEAPYVVPEGPQAVDDSLNFDFTDSKDSYPLSGAFYVPEGPQAVDDLNFDFTDSQNLVVFSRWMRTVYDKGYAVRNYMLDAYLEAWDECDEDDDGDEEDGDEEDGDEEDSDEEDSDEEDSDNKEEDSEEDSDNKEEDGDDDEFILDY